MGFLISTAVGLAMIFVPLGAYWYGRSEQRKLDKRLEPYRKQIRETAKRVEQIPRSRVYRSED